MALTISYGPRRVPDVSDMVGSGEYTLSPKGESSSPPKSDPR
jgi:hypothetical protein